MFSGRIKCVSFENICGEKAAIRTVEKEFWKVSQMGGLLAINNEQQLFPHCFLPGLSRTCYQRWYSEYNVC